MTARRSLGESGSITARSVQRAGSTRRKDRWLKTREIKEQDEWRSQDEIGGLYVLWSLRDSSSLFLFF
jgi:hypothetical protein